MHVFGTLPHKLSCAIHEIRFPGISAQKLFERYQEYPGQFKSPRTEHSSVAHCPVSRSRDDHSRHQRKRDRLYNFFRHCRTRRRPRTRRHSPDLDEKNGTNHSQHWSSANSFMDLIYPSSQALQVPIKHDSPLMIELSRSRLWLGSSMDSVDSLQSASVVSPFAAIPYPSFIPNEPSSPSFMPFALHSPLALPTMPPPPPVDPTVARGIMTLEHNEVLET